jgi:hypothetical protein
MTSGKGAAIDGFRGPVITRTNLPIERDRNLNFRNPTRDVPSPEAMVARREMAVFPFFNWRAEPDRTHRLKVEVQEERETTMPVRYRFAGPFAILVALCLLAGLHLFPSLSTYAAAPSARTPAKATMQILPAKLTSSMQVAAPTISFFECTTRGAVLQQQGCTMAHRGHGLIILDWGQAV